MQGPSRDSLASARERLDALIDSGADAETIAAELLGVVRLLDREISLRRGLTDPARRGEQKAELVRSLLAGKVSDDTIDLLDGMVRSRWSRPRDLADAIETVAVHSYIAVADRQGDLDELEDALFRFGRIVAGQPTLRAVLTDTTVPAQPKVELVHSLLDGKVTPVAERLISQLVAYPRGRALDQGLDAYAQYAAERQRRVMALVKVAVPLTEQQKRRLVTALKRMYGFDVHLNVEIDPDVIGGISVRVRDEVVDGTVISRLDRARRHMTS
jgi:F-type H+-transporting ATPase subunit delta